MGLSASVSPWLPPCCICAVAQGRGPRLIPPPPPRAADRPCGQEPPAGDGAHGARAGHRLVPSQRQRHRQRLRGHHRYGEGRAVGGVWRAPPPPPFPLLCRLQSVTDLFLEAVPCVCAAGGGRRLHDAALYAKYTLPATQHRGGHMRHNGAVPPLPPSIPPAPRAPCSIRTCIGAALRLIIPVFPPPPGVADPRLRPRAQHHGAGGDAGGALQARGHHLLAPHSPQRAAERRWGSPQVPWESMVKPQIPTGDQW